MTEAMRKLLARRKKALEEARKIADLCKTEERARTDDESTKYTEYIDSTKTLDAEIEELRELEALEASEVRHVVTPEGVQPAATVPAEVKGPAFRSMGDFCNSVMLAADPSANGIDKRLLLGGGDESRAAATVVTGTSPGASAGFLIPDEQSTVIREFIFTDDSLLPMTDQTVVSGNTMTFPRDETTPWGTSAVQAYWAAESATVTQTRPVLGEATLKLNKLMCLAPVTDEMMSDSPVIGQHIAKKAGEAIRWKIDDAIINGSGSGEPLGIATSAAGVSFARGTATTVKAAEVSKMFGRLTAGSHSKAVWLIHPDVFQQLPQMVIGDTPVWLPPTAGIGGFQPPPLGTLFGRPVIESQTCQTLGTLGDIRLVDLSQYITITKGTSVEQALSIHLLFDYGQQIFRFVFRLDGKPFNLAAQSPANGSETTSPFVAIAAA